MSQVFADEYLQWLKTKIRWQQVGEYTEITTPFLDRHNDLLQIYVKKNGDHIIITDDGYTITDLALSGVDLKRPARQSQLKAILNRFGISLNDDTLIVETTINSFAQKKHLLVQAMLAVNDMFLTARPHVKSFFLEDVKAFLQDNDIRFTSSVSFTGRSGFFHQFDFVIPGHREIPERIIKAINSPGKSIIQSLIFSWNDTAEVRSQPSQCYAFINQGERKINESHIEALARYEIHAVPWNNHQQYIQELQA